jgi:predicted oxidoreductase (fatty acid repression mutant protein)
MKLWNSNSEIKIEENKKAIEKTLKHIVVETVSSFNSILGER